jgi:hypothetical protein
MFNLTNKTKKLIFQLYLGSLTKHLNLESSGMFPIMMSGTTIGGNDVVTFYSVGVVNHAALHGLILQSGQAYYATVQGKVYHKYHDQNAT